MRKFRRGFVGVSCRVGGDHTERMASGGLGLLFGVEVWHALGEGWVAVVIQAARMRMCTTLGGTMGQVL